MPDSSGFGSYTESGLVIPAWLHGQEVNFVSQMYLDDDPPIAAGREIWGFSEEVCASEAGNCEGHADRHTGICRPTRRHGHHGLQA
jgi:acetoacetate decarboxylase